MSFETRFMLPLELFPSFFPVSQWEAWNLFQMTSDGATRFNVTNPKSLYRGRRKNLFNSLIVCMRFAISAFGLKIVLATPSLKISEPELHTQLFQSWWLNSVFKFHKKFCYFWRWRCKQLFPANSKYESWASNALHINRLAAWLCQQSTVVW